MAVIFDRNDAHDPLLADFELSLREMDDGDEKSQASVRAKLRIWLASQMATDAPSGSLPEMIEEISHSAHQHSTSAIILLRALDYDGLIPEGTAGKTSSRFLVDLCERAIPDLCQFAGVDGKSQNFEKLRKLQSLHKKIVSLLSPLKEDYTTIQGFVTARQSLLGSLNHGRVRRYGEPYRIADVRGSVESVIARVARVTALEPTLLLDVEECRRSISEGHQIVREFPSFLTMDYLTPFLSTAEARLDEFLASTRGRFLTNITAAFQGGELQKRYPLHEGGRELRVLIPFTNLGPGLATDVRVSMVNVNEDVAFDDNQISLGHVAPGDFSVTFSVLVVKASASFEALVQIEWGELASSERKSEIFDVRVVAQKADIDWDRLEFHHPYSTSPAKGAGFVGRSEQVRMLVSRMLRRPMEPTFISGQKRVGKTSLALAALEFAASHDPDGRFSHYYILWGQIAHEDPRMALSLLGLEIERFILSEIGNPPHAQASYEGTLAPLLKVANLASKFDPLRRFVIVIDEFDEIPQELFLQGNLAETFFANLRALTTTENISIVLVGGENMPFVMERQGQKLNKYAGVNVTYFSRSTEWEDYKELIVKPTRELIVWHESAIGEVFQLSNGNPYFTKVICGEAFASAVLERDADITAAEVTRSVDTQVSGLDANLFSHLWQDGISKTGSDREPVVLQRSQVLVALARCYRKRLRSDLNNVGDCRAGLNFSQGEMTAV